MAESSVGTALAYVKVTEGAKLPKGSFNWKAPLPKGCFIMKIIPAIPTRGGADAFESSRCPDGDYITAYTAEGVLMWRRKVGDASQLPGLAYGPEFKLVPAGPPSAQRESISLTSVCDAVIAGDTREKVQELLKSRSLSHTGPEAGDTWTVEEPAARCKLWFDDKSAVVRKSKTLTD
jgi:hypothetical protein